MHVNTWKVTGTKRGQLQTVTVIAPSHNDAVRIASKGPHMLVVRDCVLVEGQ